MPTRRSTISRHRRCRHAAGALTLILALAGTRALQADEAEPDALAGARQEFVEAYSAVDSTPPDAVPHDSETLKAYPLYPYVLSARLQRRLDDPAAAPDIRSFLDTYGDQPVARALRSRWLMALAVSRRWEDYLATYEPSADDTVAARCNAYAARIALGRTDALGDAVIAEWNVPKRLPPACDPAVEWARARGLLTPDLLEQRARAALAAGESGLARELAASLTPPAAAPIVQWADLIDRPRESVEAYIAAPERPVDPVALLDGWRRYARIDANAAADRYPALVDARHLDARGASPFALATAVQLALSRKSRALDFFALGQPG